MDLIKSFVIDGTSYEVDTRWKDNKPLYRATDIAKVLGIKNIRQTLQNIPEDEKEVIRTYTPGGEQNVVYLREQATYIIVVRSNKPIAEPFRRWLVSVAETIREKGRYEMERRLEDESRRFRVECSKIRHDSLVSAFQEKTPVVYFGRIRTDDPDASLVKIGRTDDVYTRKYGLVAEYGSFHYVEIFRCPANEDLEIFLHTHGSIRPYAVSEPVGNRKYKELYKFTEEQLTTAIEVAKRNLHRFDVPKKTRGKRKELERQIENLQKMIEEHVVKKGHSDVDGVDAAHAVHAVDETLMTDTTGTTTPSPTTENNVRQQHQPYIIEDTRRYTMGRGNKVQRYSPDGTTLLRTYVGFMEAERDPELDSPVHNVIRLAIKNRTTYKGFRWAELDRGLEDTTHQEIGQTVTMPTQRKGLVAMLHVDGSHIVRVFSDQKEAAQDRCFKGCAPISAAIQRGSVSGGHRFRMWYDCSDDLKRDFFARGGQLPSPRVRANAHEVQQLHPLTGEVLRTFTSVAHVIKEYPMSRASLAQAAESDLVKKGYKWRFFTRV